MNTLDISMLDKFDQLIRLGKSDQVKSQIGSYPPSKIPRKLKSAFAKIALRVGWPQLAFATLRPLVASKTPVHPKVNTDELLQYGMSLKQLGATNQALKLFESIESTGVAEVYLYEAITLFTQARHSESIPKLNHYLLTSNLTPYQKVIGQLNLATALVFEMKYIEALDLLNEVIAECKKSDHQLLHGNSLELKSQIFFHQNNIVECERLLNEAHLLIQSSSQVYQLFLSKWQALLNLKRDGSVEKIESVKKKAIEVKHFETLRECDFYRATITKNSELLNYVYFGSPYPSYRSRLLKFFDAKHTIPEFYYWPGQFEEGRSLSAPKRILNLVGEESNQKKDAVIRRFLESLSCDFYNPIKPVPLYLMLYPEDNLDPELALPKIFSNLTRVKKWLTEQELPLTVNSDDDGYRLKWLGAVSVKVPRSINLEDPDTQKINKLKQVFGENLFSSSEAAKALQISPRSAVRFLGTAEIQGKLSMTGKAKGTRYRIG